MDFSPVQIGIVLLIVLIVFGPSRLPELGKSMGKGIREFKDSLTSSNDDDDSNELSAGTTSTGDPVETEVVRDNQA